MIFVNEFIFKPIGYIESCYQDKFGTPRQPGLNEQALSQLKIRSDLQPELALQDLDGFSHVWVIFVFHLNKTSRYHAKVHPPRLGGDAKGLFSTRTPHRPNNIGLSLVKLKSVEKDTLIFSGADLVNGTPILDIKPYLPSVESIPDAKVGWLEKVQTQTIEVVWMGSSKEQLKKWSEEPMIKNLQQSEGDLCKLVEVTLQLDPRPTIYKGFESETSPYRSAHAVRLYNKDIHFTFTSPTTVEVLEIKNLI